MGSAVEIVMELYEALSEKERAEVVEKILKASTVKSGWAAASADAARVKSWEELVVALDATEPVTLSPHVVTTKPKGRGWKKPPYWTKTVDSVDHMSVNASGAEGKWGFDVGQAKPVLFGFSKPRHLYAVLKATPGGMATITDDDGFEVTVPNAEVLMTSKDWLRVREKLAEMLAGF